MKRLYILFFIILTGLPVLGQKTAVDPIISPTLFKPSDQITVTYDVTGTTLASLTNAYIWVWIPGKNTNAKYNINPATAAANTAKFTKKVEGGKTTFSITFVPADFFDGSIAAETQLGMLLKAADWAQGQTTDYLTDFWSGAFEVRLTSPTVRPLFVDTNDDILITAEASVSADYKLYVNDVLTSTQNDVIIFSYTHTVTETSGAGTVKLTAESDGSTSETTFQYLVSAASPVAARPAGIIEGINYSNDHTKATLCVLAPGKSSVYVRGDFTDWLFLPEYLMKRDGEHFWIELTGLVSGQEYAFQYLLDESVYIADPYADKILDPDDQYISDTIYPSLKEYPQEALSDNWYFNRTSVLQTNQTPYNWQVPDFEKPARENLVVYELLVRDFFDNTNRSYKNLMDTIPYLKRLGVNAVELMPIMEFSGNDSWGYNPTFMFAPDKYFGSKNDLKAFVDECHAQGIAVILDIAMNHQDMPNPFLFTDFNFNTFLPNPTNKWFNVKATHPFSVFFDMNHESLYTKAYLDTVNHYWLNEFKVDGFRFDLSKGFTQTSNPLDVNKWSAYDASRVAILKRMADKIWGHTPDAFVILEHLAVNTEEKELAEYRAGEGKGMMLWGNMNHSFSQLTMGWEENSDISGVNSGSRNWTVPHLVSYMESHDEERLAYRNKEFGNEAGSYSTKDKFISMERIKAASVIFYSVPGPKMLWQFGELGYDYSINTCPDGVTVSDNCRVDAKPVRWDYKTDADRAGLFKHTSDLIKLHNSYSVFASGVATVTPGSSLIKQVSVKNTPYTETPANTSQMNVQTVANFDLSNKTIAVNFPHAGTWYDYYDRANAINVTAVPFSVELPAGGFKLYTDVPIGEGPITEVENARSEANALVVTPNPTTGAFRISIPRGMMDFSLVDSRGMRHSLVRNEEEFDISHVAPGMYILVGRERSGKRSFVKIIKY
jgi:1,4-alpha-glucan branching enzyme